MNLNLTHKFGKKWLVGFNARKTELVSFNWCNSSSAIDMEMDGSIIEEKSTFKMLKSFSSNLDCGSYIILFANIVSQKTGALHFVNFLFF